MCSSIVSSVLVKLSVSPASIPSGVWKLKVVNGGQDVLREVPVQARRSGEEFLPTILPAREDDPTRCAVPTTVSTYPEEAMKDAVMTREDDEPWPESVLSLQLALHYDPSQSTLRFYGEVGISLPQHRSSEAVGQWVRA